MAALNLLFSILQKCRIQIMQICNIYIKKKGDFWRENLLVTDKSTHRRGGDVAALAALAAPAAARRCILSLSPHYSPHFTISLDTSLCRIIYHNTTLLYITSHTHRIARDARGQRVNLTFQTREYQLTTSITRRASPLFL